MSFAILVMASIAVTVGIAGLVTCVKDAIDLNRRIRERERDKAANGRPDVHDTAALADGHDA